VPSPEPVEVFEQDIIKKILDLGMIVIAVGGGGIPVVEKKNYLVLGSEAVIDKDRASSLLASHLNVDLFIISTDAEFVYLNFKKPTQRALTSVTAKELERYQDEGQFPPGSMGPKIESAIRFLHNGGSEVIITSAARLVDAVERNYGTHITR
jgi:carbamate kinase